MAVTVGIVGPSGTGKTSLAVALVGAITGRGLTVGYVKHAHHGFEVDREGSDTDRLRRAGAGFVGAVGPGDWFVLAAGMADADVLASRMKHFDVVLAEGWHDAPWPKIVVERPGVAERPVGGPVLATVALDEAGAVAPEDLGCLLDAIETLARPALPALELRVDGEVVPVAGFARTVLDATVRGLLSALHGGSGSEIVLVLRAPGRPTDGD